jgi:hypothetical protein
MASEVCTQFAKSFAMSRYWEDARHRETGNEDTPEHQ